MDFKSMDVALLVTAAADVTELEKTLEEIELLEGVLRMLEEIGDVLGADVVVDFTEVDGLEVKVELDVSL